MYETTSTASKLKHGAKTSRKKQIEPTIDELKFADFMNNYDAAKQTSVPTPKKLFSHFSLKKSEKQKVPPVAIEAAKVEKPYEEKKTSRGPIKRNKGIQTETDGC